MSIHLYFEVRVFEVVNRYSGDQRTLVKDKIECESVEEAARLWDDYLSSAGYDYSQKQERRLL
jgi:hypothetical protein